MHTRHQPPPPPSPPPISLSLYLFHTLVCKTHVYRKLTSHSHRYVNEFPGCNSSRCSVSPAGEVSPSSSPCSWLCIPYRFYTYSSIFFYNLKRDKQNTLIRVAAFDMEVTGAVGPPIQSQIYKHKRNKVCKRTQTRACFHTHNTNERGSSLERLSP